MRIDVEIDSRSGFCNGVVRAIDRAEAYLKNHDELFSLGAIVHNASELNRLKGEGLEIISKEQLPEMTGKTLLIRAHGEPPSTYIYASQHNLNIIDCTCPVVLQLQKRVHSIYQELLPKKGLIVIFGKKDHAEVNGLVGQTNGEAIVIDSVDAASKLDFSRPITLFSQTTKDPEEFRKIANFICSKSKNVQVFDTICRQVAQRHSHLKEFASSHSIIFFVSGKESSNGKVLFDLCRSVNSRTYWLENASELDISLLTDGDSVGICGATSTPKWQLEEIFIYLQRLSD